MLFFSGPISSFEISTAVASQAWTWYKHALKTQPLLTKAVTSSGMMSFSDVVCQKITMDPKEEDNKLDVRRMVEVAITGLTWSGPVTHYWYGILFKVVNIQDPILGLLARIIIDAIVFSPVTVSGYFLWRSMLEGSGFKGAQQKIQAKLKSTVIGAWKFWPAANIINFSVVPFQYRVLYMNVLSLFWTGYLTFVNQNAKRALENEK